MMLPHRVHLPWTSNAIMVWSGHGQVALAYLAIPTVTHLTAKPRSARLKRTMP